MKSSNLINAKLRMALLSGLALLATGCGSETEGDLVAPLRQVRSIVVSSGSGFFEASYSGTLRAAQEANLSFKVSGTIQDIAVEVGDRVQRGDVIASLDPSLYALEAQRLQSTLSEAESGLRNARSNFERVRNLYESGNQSRSDLDTARSQFESSEANVETAKRALEIANLDLSYTRLQAESDCAIASVNAEEGENISQGAQVFYATCGSELEVSLDIPESVISNIEQNMEVEVTFSALGQAQFRGLVNEVGVTSIQGGTTYPVTVTIVEPLSNDLIAGLSADVSFMLATDRAGQDNAPIVPAFAIAENQTGRFAYVLEPSGEGRAIVRSQAVVVGRIQPQGIEVLEGLTPGMRVVTAGVSVLREGMEVLFSDETNSGNQ